MIVRRNLSVLRVVATDRAPLLYAVGVAVVVTAAFELFDVAHLALPFAPVGTLGAAVAIFAAFRINAANARWAEARMQWATIQNSSRVLIRQLMAATTNSVATGAATPEAAAAYRREMAGRLIAFAYVLGALLRGTEMPVAAERWLPDDLQGLAGAVDPSNLVLQSVAVRVKDGVREGMVGQFDPITLEPALGALNTAATTCQRIKHTPTPASTTTSPASPSPRSRRCCHLASSAPFPRPTPGGRCHSRPSSPESSSCSSASVRSWTRRSRTA